MATPPTLRATELAWPPPTTCPHPPDADHVWVLDVEREKVVEVEGEPHVLTPLKKIYTDPFGLTAKIKRKKVEDAGGCPLCHRLFVSQLSGCVFR